MSKVYLVNVVLSMPVVADSEEEARNLIMEDYLIPETALRGLLDSTVEDDDVEDVLDVIRVTEADLDGSRADLEDLMPWGDDGGRTIGEIVRDSEDTTEDEDDADDRWHEPAHEDD